MKLFTPVRSLVIAGAVALVLVGISASTSSAFGPRVPQVAMSPASLQGYLNGVGESINVQTDQVDAQKWNTSVSGNATFTIMIEFAGNAASNNIGVYNIADGPVPTLFQVFPGAAAPGWYATCHFASGNLTVSLFDNTAAFQGNTVYPGVSANNFGFYLQGPGGTFYSEDARNAGSSPQMLTYLGTGQNFGDWWECFEDLPYIGGDGDFEDAVLLLQSVAPTATNSKTWGSIKALYK